MLKNAYKVLQVSALSTVDSLAQGCSNTPIHFCKPNCLNIPVTILVFFSQEVTLHINFV